MGRILIRGAKQLLTLRGAQGPRRGAALAEIGLIPDGSVLIAGGLIQEANITRRVENLAEARDALDIEATGRVVMPGFVDSNTHLITEAATSSARLLELRAKRLLDSMLLHGTTTVESKAGQLKTLKVLRSLGVIATVEGDEALLAKARQQDLAAHAAVAQNAEGWRDVAAAARRLGFRVKMRGTSSDGADVIECSCLPSQADLETIVTLSADSAVFRGDVQPGAGRALADAGFAVALATGYNPPSGPVANMQIALALGIRHFGLTPAEAIAAATINGAHALRIGGQTGSLEIGKHADLLILETGDYRDLASCVGVNWVRTVLRRGEIIAGGS